MKQTTGQERKVFPAALLLEGKDCLVVGGGKEVSRRIRSLLEVGARVTVLSPDLHDEIKDLVTQGAVQHLARSFEDGDIKNYFLVFALTDDRAANRHILEVARQTGRMSCAADEIWPEGSFVTPATFRRDHLTVAVTSGGRSCRQSRIVRDNLARHVDMIASTDLLVLGTSHEQLAIEQREPYHLTGDKLLWAGRLLMQVWGVQEFMLLNTCNRIELIAVAACHEATQDLLRCILKFDKLPEESYYIKTGLQAFEHLALLTAGLYSQTPGENHIVAQVKEASATAQKAGWAANLIEAWLAANLHVAKHIRAATEPKLKGMEIEDLCLEYLKRNDQIKSRRKVMVVGTGVVGKGLIERCVELGLECHWCYHLNEPEVPAKLREHVRVSSFNGLRDNLRGVDLVLCAIAGAAGHVLHSGHAPFFDQEKNVLMVDLGMPRNVAPELGRLGGNLRIVDLDGLKHWYRRELADLEPIYELGRHEVRAHKEMYDKLVHDIQGGHPQ